MSVRTLRPAVALSATRLWLGWLAVVLLALTVLSIGVGSSFIGPGRVLAALVHAGPTMDEVIVWTIRLPRVALALLAGSALALSGALLQRAARNPLASPDILGIVDGAAVGVLVFLFVFSNSANFLTVSVGWQPAFAAAGAVAFALAVASLTLRDGGDPLRLILYGVALAALAKAIVTLLMIVGPVYRSGQALIWLAGSVQAADWADVRLLAAVLAVVLPLLVLSLAPLDQLRLDPDSAFSTGLPVAVERAGVLALSVVLSAAAVSCVGGVGFVGLVAPHAARLLLGSRSGPLLVGSALIGAAMVLAADLLVRAAFQPLEVPAGAVTAAIGAPYFLWLLTRKGHAHA